jgi:hypothetical protein
MIDEVKNRARKTSDEIDVLFQKRQYGSEQSNMEYIHINITQINNPNMFVYNGGEREGREITRITKQNAGETTDQ